MSLLNGVESENKIADKYGANKLVYSYFIGHSAVRKGREVNQDGVHKIIFGKYSL
jgi:2-dehydropantoate 2-reductase